MEDVYPADVAYRKIAHCYRKGIPETQNTGDQNNVCDSKVLRRCSLCPLSHPLQVTGHKALNIPATS